MKCGPTCTEICQPKCVTGRGIVVNDGQSHPIKTWYSSKCNQTYFVSQHIMNNNIDYAQG